MLSWEKVRVNVYRLQKRILKAVLVGDIKKCFQIQKLLISSNSACLLSIRLAYRNNSIFFSRLDNKTQLSFSERFKLVKFLQDNAFNWVPQNCKEFFIFADISWQILIKLALQPAHEAIFSPRSFGSRNDSSVYEVQKILFLNLNKLSYGFQKRVLKVTFQESFSSFDTNILLKKIIAPRTIKLGIFRFLKSGFFPSLKTSVSLSNLENLLGNILLYGIEEIGNTIRYNSHFLILLNPFDNEFLVIDKLDNFLVSLGLDKSKRFLKIYDTKNGFDFLNWHFKIFKNLNLYCTPSMENYRKFLKRVKLIINNSNYGSSVKVLKIIPIIKEWRIYNQFCNLKDFKTSLFFLQKKAFKAFNKESKNDRYSTKRLINKSFIDSNFKKNILKNNSFVCNFHISFWFEYKKSFSLQIFFVNKSFCVYCGLDISNFL